MRGTVRGRWAMVVLAGLLMACDRAVDPVGVPVASVTVEPKEGVWTGTLSVGQTVALAARARAVDGSEVSGESVAWSSADTTVAAVDGAGTVTARGAGTTTVRATVRGKTGATTVVVVPAVALVLIAPQAVVLAVGQTRQFTAHAFDAAGHELSGRVVTWSTSANGVASIDGSGLVRALVEGYSDVTATIEGRAAAVGLTVVPADQAQ